MEDDVDVWRYAILELHARNDDDDDDIGLQSQNTTVLAKCINRIFVFTNKFLTSFFDS